MKPHWKCFYVCLSLWQNWHAPFVWFFRRDDTNPLQQNLHKLFNTVMALPAAWSVSSIFLTILWTYFSFSLAAVGFQEKPKDNKGNVHGSQKIIKKKWWEMGSVWYQLIKRVVASRFWRIFNASFEETCLHGSTLSGFFFIFLNFNGIYDCMHTRVCVCM